MVTGRLLVLVCIAGAVVATTLVLRHQATARLQNSLRRKYAVRIAQLPTEQAVQLLRQLSTSPELALTAVVGSLGDERAAVRAAASAELNALVERYSSLPTNEQSAHAQELAALLAQRSPQIPLGSRATAHAIARTILAWPLDGRAVDVARVIANCEQVLALPCEEPEELRVADARREPMRLSTPPAASISDE
jgi:hypothetical protein